MGFNYLHLFPVCLFSHSSPCFWQYYFPIFYNSCDGISLIVGSWFGVFGLKIQVERLVPSAQQLEVFNPSAESVRPLYFRFLW